LSISAKTGFWLLCIFTVLPGLLGVAIFGYYSFVDWAALQAAYKHYAQVVNTSAELQVVFVAESNQNIHRINLFAEGVWTLLSAILAAVGLHGMVGIGQRLSSALNQASSERSKS
jgi:hypothetical protein